MNQRTPHQDLLELKWKINDKDRILKLTREQLVTNKGNPIRLSAYFSAEILQARVSSMIYSKCWEEKKNPNNNTLPHKIIIQNWSRDKEFQDKES